ncbi:MAG: hypothetical protein CML04_10555 [Pseudozobellia sp.]|nr:hypothetical protein [Pseudozobellia sp.]MBG47051.1 hypothetical protein [Pseudozobellia sp.]|tara:strand:+ start:815 stop:1075 length:261 start_codon:yes stop_codon:yes gene_type:complete
MIEVFITNLTNEFEAKKVFNLLTEAFPNLKVDYDFDETGLPYPCGHTIIRVEGSYINAADIMKSIRQLGFQCEILEDIICTKKSVL